MLGTISCAWAQLKPLRQVASARWTQMLSHWVAQQKGSAVHTVEQQEMSSQPGPCVV
jgi:hypothetical protein